MSSYRRGAVLGLTVAEAFILFTFLLLIALLGLSQPDDPQLESDPSSPPRIWVRPEEIETLVNSAKQAREARDQAEHALAAAQQELDQTRDNAERAQRAAEAAANGRAAAERERDQAHQRAELAAKDLNHAEKAVAIAKRNLELFRRKGENPPCWYQIVKAGENKTREKPHYLFNVAIHEDSIELARRPPPPGGAADDGDTPYVEEWRRLRIAGLPYGRRLSDEEFSDAVTDLVARGRNSQVRSYECVFSVMVWDKTPNHAKERWKYAHDRIIEGSFSAYTVQDLEWTGAD